LVWDRFVRLTHWILLAGVAAAWFTRHGFGRIHDLIGYLALLVVVLRIGWGFFGTAYARFSQFIYRPSQAIHYAALFLRGTQNRYLGHNPLGGWMSLLLWTMVLLVCISGWLYTTDRYWGVEWVESLHRLLTNALLACVGLHIIGVIVASWHDRENLIFSMIHGKKRRASAGDR